jgi:hypothetical protein
MNETATISSKPPPFPSTPASGVKVGDDIYVLYGIQLDDEEEADDDTRYVGYLAKVIHKGPRTLRIHFYDSMNSKLIDEDKTVFYEDIESKELVHMVTPASSLGKKPANPANSTSSASAETNKLVAGLTKQLQKVEQKLTDQETNVMNELKKIKRISNQKPKSWAQHVQPSAPVALQHQQQAFQQQAFQQQSAQQQKPIQNPINELIIQNIPYEQKENLTDMILNIATKKQLDITEDDFTAFRTISRQKQPNKPDKPPNIIIRFNDSRTKNDFRKRTETQVTLRDIFPNEIIYDGTTNIYINENLSLETRKLYYATRTHKREYDYKYAWTKDGEVFLRQNDDSKILKIHSTETLKDLADAARKLDKQRKED